MINIAALNKTGTCSIAELKKISSLKKILVVLLLTAMLTSCGHTEDLKIQVSNSDGKMNLKIEANGNGKDIDYDQTFDVRGLSKTEQDAIIDRVKDSLKIK